MAYYAVLSIATVTIAALSVAVWRKTRQVAFLLGFAFLYYWSLYGGWLVVNRGLGADRSYRFEYLFYRLFPIYLDEYYLWSLVMYALFIVTIQIAVLVTARRPVGADDAPAVRIRIAHWSLLAVSAIVTAGAYGLAWPAVAGAISSGVSAYGALSVPGLIPLPTLYQILHQSALTFAFTGATVYLSGPGARYVVGRRGRAAWGYALVLGALGTLSVAMGNRSMLVFASVGAGLFYLVNASRPSRLLMATGALLVVATLSVLGIVRGAGGQRELSDQNLVGKMQYVVSDALSQDVEAFAAHASMYGTLQKQVPLTYGASFIWLATSIIPAVIRPDIVPIAYSHYAAHVGASADQGFTLHHAAGWYINFGVAGVVCGAMLFGWLWAQLFNAFGSMQAMGSHFGRVFAATAFWTFTAYTPILVRSGPEGYKGVVVEALLIPTLLMVAASVTVVRRAGRPRLVPVGFAGVEDTRMPFDMSRRAGREAW